jgi:hypothetical protein
MGIDGFSGKHVRVKDSNDSMIYEDGPVFGSDEEIINKARREANDL